MIVRPVALLPQDLTLLERLVTPPDVLHFVTTGFSRGKALIWEINHSLRVLLAPSWRSPVKNVDGKQKEEFSGQQTVDASSNDWSIDNERRPEATRCEEQIRGIQAQFGVRWKGIQWQHSAVQAWAVCLCFPQSRATVFDSAFAGAWRLPHHPSSAAGDLSESSSRL